MASRIYMTGAGGRLGQRVLPLISGAMPLVRSRSGLGGEVETDFSAASLKSILADATLIIHIAGSVDTLDRRGLRESNVELTERIVDAAPKGCRILFASSISVYGKLLSEIPADEETPVKPDSDYSRSKLDAEKAVSARKDHVILRLGTLYGPGFEDYFRILKRLEQGRMKLIGRGENRIPFLHVDDAAKAFQAAVTKGNGTYVIAGEPLTQKRVYELAAEGLGVKPPERRIDRRSAILLAAFAEIAYRLGGKRPSLTREHIGVLAYDRAFDCGRAKKDLGFSPRPLEAGIKEMVRAYKARSPGAKS
jgi:nucleoside-diphosphate-sugar epimerase